MNRAGFKRKWTPDKAEEVFNWWMDNDCAHTATASHYNVSTSTLARYRQRFEWDKRAKGMQQKVRDANDRKRIKQEVSNLTMAQAVLQKEVAGYLHRDHKPTGNLNAIATLMRYIDEIQGNMPTGDNHGDNIVNIYANLSPDEQERVRNNALVGLTDGNPGDRGPFTPVPSGCVRTSE